MEALIIYIIKSTIVSGIFLSIYYLGLKRETFFKLNRFFLIVSLLYSYLFPFIKITLKSEKESPVYLIQDFQTTINQFNFTDSDHVPLNAKIDHSLFIDNWWIIVLVSISSIFLFRFLKHLIQIQKNITAHEKINHHRFTLVLFNQPYTFSFFRYIFISPNVWRSSESKSIIDHELSHLRHKHSLDRIYLEILQIVFWMNPFIYLYKKALEEVHEFQADEDATQNSQSISDYFSLVLQQSSQAYSPLMSPFSYKLIKKRIKMATYQSNPLKKLFIVAPLLIAVLMVMASATLQQESVINNETEELTWPVNNSKSDIFYTDLPDNPLPLKPALKENTLMILINYKGVILLDGVKTSIDNFEKAFISQINNTAILKKEKDIPLLGKQLGTDAHLFLQKDKNTPKEIYSKALNLIEKTYTNIRNEAALNHFNTAFSQCSEEQQNAIVELVPIQILFSAPKNMKPQRKTNSLFSSPIKQSDLKRISSGYGYRYHPILKKKMKHNGVDYVAALGADVLCIGDGKVRKVEQGFTLGKGHGRFVIVDHANGYSSLYAQLNGYKVKEGQEVKEGDIIGSMGSSGISTGPHLHLEIKKDGEHIDPQSVINKKVVYY